MWICPTERSDKLDRVGTPRIARSLSLLVVSCWETVWKGYKSTPWESSRESLQELYSSEPLLRALGWTTLEKRRYKALVCLVHRCLSDEAPSFPCSKFRPNTALGYIRTRGANKLHLPRPKTEYFRSTFTFQGALLYNQLPETIRRRKQIKAALHNHLLN